MLSKNEQKLIRSLQQKKFRDELGLFVAEGDKCIGELQSRFETVLYANTDTLSEQEIEKLSSLKTPQGAIAVFRKPQTNLPSRAEGLTLALDDVQDPGNLGTILRTCDWMGVQHVYCSLHTADCFAPKVVQATMGALARVEVHYVDLPQWLEKQSCPILGTFMDGEDVGSMNALQHDMIVVMGNEGNGISKEVQQYVTRKVTIPSFATGKEHVESLNVAIATAVILFAIRNGLKK